ncbi:MAG: hypothetical protein U0835_10325 [Isosphaeraceae bacterium]
MPLEPIVFETRDVVECPVCKGFVMRITLIGGTSVLVDPLPSDPAFPESLRLAFHPCREVRSMASLATADFASHLFILWSKNRARRKEGGPGRSPHKVRKAGQAAPSNQREFFKGDKSSTRVNQCKDLERRVDKAVDWVLDPARRQGQLFPNRPKGLDND